MFKKLGPAENLVALTGWQMVAGADGLPPALAAELLVDQDVRWRDAIFGSESD
jgi:hypothetical protein